MKGRVHARRRFNHQIDETRRNKYGISRRNHEDTGDTMTASLFCRPSFFIGVHAWLQRETMIIYQQVAVNSVSLFRACKLIITWSTRNHHNRKSSTNSYDWQNNRRQIILKTTNKSQTYHSTCMFTMLASYLVILWSSKALLQGTCDSKILKA